MSPSDQQDTALFQEMIDRFLDHEVEPRYQDWEQNHLMPREFWNTMGEAGLLLIDMPEIYGAAGSSFDIPQLVQVEMCMLVD